MHPSLTLPLPQLVDAGAAVEDWLAELGQDMPLAPACEMVGLTSSAASGSTSSTCAPALRADTPACTGALL